MWGFWRSSKFKRRYKKLRREQPQTANKAASAIMELEQAENPLLLGIRKKGALRDYWAYELGSDCRILYNTDWTERIIMLHRICSHKEVYQS